MSATSEVIKRMA